MAFVSAVVYLDRSGPPEFVKDELRRQLAAQGVGVDFGRLRWRWYHGCVAEGLICAKTNRDSVWRFTAREAWLGFGARDLVAKRFTLNSLSLDHATLSWQSRTNASRLALREISTELQIASQGRVVVDNFQAVLGGLRFHAGGTITNAPALTNLFLRPGRPKRDWEATLQETVDWMGKIQIPKGAELQLLLAGDALNPKDFKGALRWDFPEGRTPWGPFTRLGGFVELNKLTSSTGRNRSRLRLELGEAATVWAGVTNLLLTAQFNPSSLDWMRFESRLRARIGAVSARGIQAGDLDLDLAVDQTLTNALPESVSGTISGRGVVTPWGGTENFDADLQVERRAPGVVPNPNLWVVWDRLQPWVVHLKGRVAGLKTPKIEVESARFDADWDAPTVTVKSLEARLYSGGLSLGGVVNAATREAATEGSFDFDSKRVSHLLSPKGQKWLSQFDWEKPPLVRGRLLVTLPPWGVAHPAWKQDVMPTLRLAGTARGGPGKFRGVPSTGVNAAFAFTNDTWTLPAVHATRPEGAVDFAYVGNVLTHEFRFEGSGEVDPFAVESLTPPKFHRFFDWFSFTTPPRITGEVAGNWSDHQQARLSAHVSGTNFFFKGVSVDSFQSDVRASNQWLHLTRSTALKGKGVMTAAETDFDFKSHMATLGNLHENFDPATAAGLISPVFATNVQKFSFPSAPNVAIDGWVSTRDFSSHDLTLEVKGESLVWQKARLGPFSARGSWRDRDVSLTNFVVRPPRGPGSVTGWAAVRYNPGEGAAFSLNSTFSDLDIRSVGEQFLTRTNRLEGTLGGRFVITAGRTDRLDQWQGYGELNLHDGFLWEFPIFGIFSPILDTITPGLGQTKASEASATFIITNGVVVTDNLEMHSAVLRMDYSGTVDYKGNVNAVVEARVPRNSWLLGPVLNVLFEPVTKLFGYRVNGTLGSPNTEPLYLPKALMMALHPFKTVHDLIVGSPKKEPPGKPAPP